MWINEFTKFGVSAAAFGTLVYYHNAAASFALSGSIANSVAGKILKRVLNIPRPGSAPKARACLRARRANYTGAASGLLLSGGASSALTDEWSVRRRTRGCRPATP